MQLSKLNSQVRLVAQVLANLDQARRRDFDPGIDGLQVRAGDLVAEFGFEALGEGLGCH